MAAKQAAGGIYDGIGVLALSQREGVVFTDCSYLSVEQEPIMM